MFKRYMLFAGLDYYPEGGMKDFIGDYETVDEAKVGMRDWCKERDPYSPWAHIYDAYGRKVVWTLVEQEAEDDHKRRVEEDVAEWSDRWWTEYDERG